MSIIGKRYRLEEEIGSGGMGTVYRGVDTRTGGMVAVKKLKREVSEPTQIERFRREGAALRDLDHPYIVKMLDAISENGDHFLVMEYLSNGDLHDLIQTEYLDTHRILRLATMLSHALRWAHDLDIIHRDLKPANVLLADDGTVRLTDFGIAHLGTNSPITDKEIVIGTLDYLAPEILNGEGVSVLSDIWAFGVVLYEMITGQHPFAGKNIAETVTSILTRDPPDLRDLRPDVPDTLVDLVNNMLARDREKRVCSVQQVSADLNAILMERIAVYG